MLEIRDSDIHKSLESNLLLHDISIWQHLILTKMHNWCFKGCEEGVFYFEHKHIILNRKEILFALLH